jgi:hypothetical protein
MEGGSNDGQSVQVMEEKNKELQKQDRVIGLDYTYLLNNYHLKNVDTGRKSLSEGYMALYGTIQNAGECIENDHTSRSAPSVIIIATAIAAALGPICY